MTKSASLPYPIILLIDCADRDQITVALLRDRQKPIVEQKDGRAQELPQVIEDVLQRASVLPAGLKALALVKRTGSMTAIRIGTATTNTLAWLNRLPIMEVEAVSAHAAMAMLESGQIGSVVKSSQPFA